MSEIKGFIFDMDGTLVDSMGVWVDVDKEYLESRGFEVPEDLFSDASEGNSFTEVAYYFKDKFGIEDSIETIIQEWTELVAHKYEKSIRLKSGVKEFLDAINQQGYKIGVGTSNSLALAGKALKANDILHYFSSIVTGCQDIKGKPFPDIFLKSASELGLEPSECIVFEDVLAGVDAARRAGMRVIAIYDEYAKDESTLIEELVEFYGKNFYEIAEYCVLNGLLRG
ncbi:MAG: HAD family phosphatase [Candidatus Cloacimonadia bacterium]